MILFKNLSCYTGSPKAPTPLRTSKMSVSKMMKHMFNDFEGTSFGKNILGPRFELDRATLVIRVIGRLALLMHPLKHFFKATNFT